MPYSKEWYYKSLERIASDDLTCKMSQYWDFDVNFDELALINPYCYLNSKYSDSDPRNTCFDTYRLYVKRPEQVGMDSFTLIGVTVDGLLCDGEVNTSVSEFKELEKIPLAYGVTILESWRKLCIEKEILEYRLAGISQYKCVNVMVSDTYMTKRSHDLIQSRHIKL